LFNKFIETKTFPSVWKDAKVTAIFKSLSQTCPPLVGYRPLKARVWVRNGVRLRFGDAVKFGIVAQLVPKFYHHQNFIHLLLLICARVLLAESSGF
jgi:hypothetical protein